LNSFEKLSYIVFNKSSQLLTQIDRFDTSKFVGTRVPTTASGLVTALPVECLVHLARHGLNVQGNLQELRNTLCRFLGLA
jgi:hypothetical protein